MAHWIFQSRPGTGIKERRCVKRHRDRIAPGDDVALWQTTGIGLVALGRVTGPAEPDDGTGWEVPIALLRTFADAPVARAEMMTDADFAGSAILRMPGAANPFPVTDREWAAILRHTAER